MGFIKKLKIAAVILIGSSSLTAWCGGMEGGGGIGVLCDNNLRALDIYEAEEIYQLPAVQKFSTVEKNLAHYGVRLPIYWSQTSQEANDPHIQEEFLEAIKEDVFQKFSDISNGTTLPLSEDATLPKLPANCSFVQILFYSDKDNVIYRDPSLWNKLDAYNQAAFAIHEIYYHAAREVNATLSDDVRRLIGLTMFAQLPEPMLKPLWDLTYRLECSLGKDGEEYYQLLGTDSEQNGISGVILYGQIFKSQLVSFRSTAFLPGVSTDDFPSSTEKTWQVQFTNEFSGVSWNMEMKTKGLNAQVRAWKNGEKTPGFSHGICLYGSSSNY